MQQITIPNVLLVILGLLINMLTYFKKVKVEGKPIHIDAVILLTALIGVISAFSGLIMAKDMLSAGGATLADDAPLYSIYAFICGLLPNIIIDKITKLLSYMK